MPIRRTSPPSPARVSPSESLGFRALPPFAWATVSGIAVGVSALLLAVAGRYDYHRDELYFRMLGQHPSWGYVDQPPLTPLLGRLATEVFGDTVFALRVPAALLIGVVAVLLALVARELGGGRGAQMLAALGTMSSFALASGHTLFTNAPDLVVWVGTALLLLRALLRGRPGYWLAAGAVVGVGLYNKHLVLLMLVSLAIGLLAVGPRQVLASRWPWAGAAIALAVGAPNLVYQIVNDFPQLELASAIAANKGDESRILLGPMQVLLLGPTLVPVWGAGIVALLRRPEWRPARAFAVAYPVLCVLVLALAGQYYYPIGLLYVLYAIGCVPTVTWLAGRSGRRVLIGAGVAANAAVSVVVTLPVLPIATVADTPIPAINQAIRDQVGWGSYVSQVAEAYHALSPEDQARAVVITGNYGEAGAVDRYGADYGLPEVYSGHNELYYLRQPPATATVAVVVLQGDPRALLAESFESCQRAGALHNDVGVDNEEESASVYLCRGTTDDWDHLWPRFQHFS